MKHVYFQVLYFFTGVDHSNVSRKFRGDTDLITIRHQNRKYQRLPKYLQVLTYAGQMGRAVVEECPLKNLHLIELFP